jgi:hypothetical protein
MNGMRVNNELITWSSIIVPVIIPQLPVEETNAPQQIRTDLTLTQRDTSDKDDEEVDDDVTCWFQADGFGRHGS